MAFNEGASSGNLVLIQASTASASSVIEFKTGVTGYDIYCFSFYGVTISNNGTNLLLQLSTDGGSSYTTTNYTTEAFFNAGVGFQAANRTDAGYTLALSIDNSSAAAPLCGKTYLYNFANASFRKQSFCNSTYLNGGGPIYWNGEGYYTVTTAVNAFQVLMSAGTITTGTFKLYGVQN